MKEQIALDGVLLKSTFTKEKVQSVHVPPVLTHTQEGQVSRAMEEREQVSRSRI